MKYIDINTVINSYKGFQECMTNKSWGYLALLKGCKSSIQPSIPYEVNMDIVSNFLETIFNLSSIKRTYNGGRSLYVFFSNKWETFFNDQGRFSPNIYDIAIWSYRRKAFPDNTTEKDIINIFSKEFNIPYDIIANSFNTEKKAIIFTDSLYKEENLKSGLKQIGVDVSKDNIDAKKGGVVAAPGEISRGPFIQPLYAGLDVTDYVLILQSNYNSLYIENTFKNKTEINNNTKLLPLQQIFYGAPGTGKSNTIKREVDDKNEICFRTTFHPDSDYSTFVGCYKPTKKPSEKIYTKEELVLKLNEIKTSGTTYPCQKFGAKYWESLKELSAKDIKEILSACEYTDNFTVEIAKGVGVGQECLSKYETGKITYEFVPQAFTKAYTEAWKTEEDVYLIIEEINRGNCAQIFGDLFQLLDRKNGVSEYPVDADTDLQNHLFEALAETTRTDIPEDVKNGKKLMLPSNLYIWATMNTSDQSLFPIDSAFKRRWDWKYMKIKNHPEEGYSIKIGESETDWWEFIQKINEIIASMTSSADKQLGYFFCKAKDGKIDEETFVSKVIFYLWNDVFKDYGFEDASLFRYTNKDGIEKDLTFPDFFDENGDKVDNERLADFVNKVMNWKRMES